MIVYFTPSILSQQGQELVELRNDRREIPWPCRRPSEIGNPCVRRAADSARLQEGGSVPRLKRAPQMCLHLVILSVPLHESGDAGFDRRGGLEARVTHQVRDVGVGRRHIAGLER